MKVEIGDKITALGYTFEVARIMYQDYYQGYWDVEFLDPRGGYHHWKSIYDDGHVIKKGGINMTVKELIAELNKCNPNGEIYVETTESFDIVTGIEDYTGDGKSFIVLQTYAYNRREE